jgi:hypothetical protein
MPAEATSPRRGPVLAAVAVAVALVVAGVAWAATRSSGSPPADEPGGGGQQLAVPLTMLGRGDLPGGFAWTLEARREGEVCTTFTISPGPAPPERCDPVRSSRPVEGTRTSRVTYSAGAIYITLGRVSERAERVRIAPEGAPPFEVPTLGGGTGLGVRFFVSHSTANVDESYTVLAADGTELGRVDRPKMPDR